MKKMEAEMDGRELLREIASLTVRLFGNVAFLVALFVGTNLHIERPVVFWGGVGAGVVAAVVYRLVRGSYD